MADQTTQAPASDFWGGVGSFLTGALNTAQDTYEKYLAIDLAKTQAAAQKAQPVSYTPTTATTPGPTGSATYTPTTGAAGPFGGVSQTTMVVIVGAALAALVLLRR